MSELSRRMFFCVTSVFLFSAVSASAMADLMPDYYQEAGVSADRDYLNQSESEYIDPFSGTLNLNYTDLVLPGTGGMDIVVQRNYSNFHNKPNPLLPRRTPNGFGWNQIHFGRVIHSGANFCSAPIMNDVTDNPVLELPDGSRQILANADTIAIGSRYITKKLWKADCVNYNNGSGAVSGLRVYAPNGTKYDMAWLDSGFNTLYPTTISDRNGNTITFIYTATAGGRTLIDTVNASDGRKIKFVYSNIEGSDEALLSSITANGNTWQYQYTKIPGETNPLYYLTKVIRPDNLFWSYAYKTSAGSGIYSVQTVTHPHGGKVEYTYQDIVFHPAPTTMISTAVKTKKTKSNGINVDGSWTYTFDVNNSLYDITTVISPNGTITYTHFGLNAAKNTAGSVWKVGLLLEKDIDGIRNETYVWDKGIVISSEDYKRSTVLLAWSNDINFYAPKLVSKTISLDNTSYTTNYTAHDVYGNPTTISESGYDGGGTGIVARTITQTYKHLTSAGKWVLNLPDTMKITAPSTPITTVNAKTYDAKGNMLTESQFGVPVTYTYYSNGDLNTYKDKNNNQTTYSAYKLGVAQIEKQAVNQPEMVTISRTVNNTGTIASITNGELKTTSYLYDGLGQLTRISPPSPKAPIIIGHNKTNRVVTRGVFKQTVAYDGFGRILSAINKDTATAEQVVVKYGYNALGQKIFESYPSSAISSSGITYLVDALGRITRATYTGGSFERFVYMAQNKVKYTDQKGTNVTTYGYRSYGNPDERQLTMVSAPEGSLTTIARDEFGFISRIIQDSKARDYTYYPNKYLWKITNPETDVTIFGRDNAGNMTSRQVGASPVTSYTYDGLNRLSTINYPVGTPDVVYSYFKTGKVKTITNGVGDRSYTYDVTDNLKTENILIGGISFGTVYDVNSLDHLNSVTYPSGKSVTYAPNALGRATKAIPYVNATVHHYPNGIVKDYLHVNGVLNSIALDTRQRITSIGANTSPSIGLGYGYDNNSNLMSITDSYDPTYNISLDYDGLNRLTVANGIWGAGNVSYTGSTGNIQSYNLGVTSTNYSYNLTSGLLETTSGLTGHTYNYDVYGNVAGNGQYTFTYNDASNLTAAVPVTVGTTASYQYDGEGMRVSETKNGTTLYYVYNQAGKLLGEYATDGSMRRENIYLGNRLIAKVENVPTMPTAISIPANDPDGIYTVSWTPSATAAADHVDHYQLYEATDAQFTNASLVYDGAASTASISGKAVGFYYYRVRACSAELCSDFISATGNTFVGVIPSAPGVLVLPTVNDTGSYSLVWGLSTGDLTEYQLDESTISDFSTSSSIYIGTQTTAPVNGQLSGSYYYRVRACYIAGSDSVCGPYTIGANSVVVDRIPQVPLSINVPTTESDGTYTVSWGVSDGYGKPIMAYQLFESTAPTFVGEISVYSGIGATTNLTGKTIGTTYYYRVRACTDTKCSGFQTAATGVTPDGLPPGIPASINVPVSNNTGEFFITWGAGTGDLGRYELYQADNAAFTAETLVPDADAKPLEERFYYLSTGTYYYRVRACNAVACSGYNEGANPIAVIQPPPIPLSITAPATDGDGTYTVSWAGAGGTTFNHYKLTEISSAGSSVIYSGALESFDISYREDGQYTYNLQACSADACSPSISTVVTVQMLSGYGVQYLSLPDSDYTGSYTVSWSPTYQNANMPPITSYILDESRNSNFATINRRFTVQPDSWGNGSKLLTHSVNGTYYYRVRVCTGVDSCTAFIPGSHGVIETGVPVVDASKSFEIHWDSVQLDGVIAPVYEVYQASNINFTDQTRIYTGSSLTLTISPPDDGYYYYRVMACYPGLINVCINKYHPVYYHTREIGFKIFPAVMSAINTLLLN